MTHPLICGAMSDPRQPVTILIGGEAHEVTTAYGRGKGRNTWFACTQHPDHRGEHSSCDGHGHILARWPRRKGEQRWHPGACTGHAGCRAALN